MLTLYASHTKFFTNKRSTLISMEEREVHSLLSYNEIVKEIFFVHPDLTKNLQFMLYTDRDCLREMSAIKISDPIMI